MAETTASPSLFLALKALSNLSDDIQATLQPPPESVALHPATPPLLAADPDAATASFFSEQVAPTALGQCLASEASTGPDVEGHPHHNSSTTISALTGGATAIGLKPLQPGQPFMPRVWLVNELGGDVNVCLSGEDSSGSGSPDGHADSASSAAPSKQQMQWRTKVAAAGCSMPLLLIDPWVCQLYGRHVALPRDNDAAGLSSQASTAKVGFSRRKGTTALSVLGAEEEKQLYFQLPQSAGHSSFAADDAWLGPISLDRFAASQSYSHMLHTHTSDSARQRRRRSFAMQLDRAASMTAPLAPAPLFGVIAQLQPQEEQGARVLQLRSNVQVTRVL